MYRLSVAEQLEDLRSVSENVEDYCARELFKDSFGAYGDYDTTDILRECYALVQGELADYGVFFSTDIDELFGDWVTAKSIYYLKWLVDTAQLYELLKDRSACDRVESLLESDETPITDLFRGTWLIFRDVYPKLFNLAQLEDRIQEIYSSEDFRIHTRNVIKMIRDTDATTSIPQVSRARAYIEKEINLRNHVYNEVLRLIRLLPDLAGKVNMRILNRFRDTYDQDKLSSENIRIYCVIDLGDDIPEHLQAFKERMMLKHHQTAPHHIEYWQAHSQYVPTLEHLIYLVANCNEPDEDDQQYRLNVQRLLSSAKGAFTPDILNTLSVIAGAALRS